MDTKIQTGKKDKEGDRMKKILVTNDDGIHAKGIRTLVEALSELAEVYVVAPDIQKSACGHGITMHIPIAVKEEEFPNAKQAWSATGTPADCVKLGVRELVKGVDLVVSGTNMGANVGDDCFYSGTVSGAAEGLFCGYPAIAVSICSHEPENYEPSMQIAKNVVKKVFEKGLDTETMLNINVPDLPASEIKGVRITSLGKVKYIENFASAKANIKGRFYWYTGEVIRLPQHEKSDIQAIRDNCISISPLKFDISDYERMEEFKGWEIEF